MEDSSQGTGRVGVQVLIDPADQVKNLREKFHALMRAKRIKSAQVAWEIVKVIKKDHRDLILPGRDRGIHGNVEGVGPELSLTYRAELALLGLHRPRRAGIDWTRISLEGEGKVPIALSVVLSRQYKHNQDRGQTVQYVGSGGQSRPGKQVKDQEMLRGNLALQNNVIHNRPVRLIRGWGTSYQYDGLYNVESVREERGIDGFKIFKFELVKRPDQVTPVGRPPATIAP